MKPPIRTNSSQSKLANLEKQKESEAWYKLIVKILGWKVPTPDSNKVLAKITAKEWATYSKRTLEINNITDHSFLKKTKEAIQQSGGFEE